MAYYTINTHYIDLTLSLARFSFNTYNDIMELNYAIIIPVVLIVVIFIVWLIRRNMKDEKKFEDEINRSEIKPEKHDKDHI